MTRALDEAPASQRWLDRFPKDQDVVISENRPYTPRREPMIISTGSGRERTRDRQPAEKFDADFSGPALRHWKGDSRTL